MSETKNQYLTVQALTKYIKRKFDVDPYLQRVFVIGEISNFRLRPNGHQYFSLKDNKALINAVMYKSAFARVPFEIEEGMKVLVQGRVTLYEPTGKYQLTVETIEPDGIGALYQALEQLKKRFQAEGLFDLPKKDIPRFPKKIAVITSPSGAVVRDILTTIRRRYPIVDVTVFPTRVQGKEAAQEIVNAFNLVKTHETEFDTLILARGGGSIEDLWCFNEEAVARAIIACSLPVISSIGHETDTTIADLVADYRAATPTAAAEVAVPVLREVLTYIRQLEERNYLAVSGKLQVLRKHFERYRRSYIMLQPERLYQAYLQQLDIANQKLHRYIDTLLQHKNMQMNTVKQRLAVQQPQTLINQYKKDTHSLIENLHKEMAGNYEKRQNNLMNLIQLLDAYSPLKSMQRGYSFVTKDKSIVKSVEQVNNDDLLQVNLIDGQVEAKVHNIKKQKLIDELLNEEE